MNAPAPDVLARRRSKRRAWRFAICSAAAVSSILACGDEANDPVNAGAEARESVAAPQVDDLAAGGGRHFATYAHVCAVIERGLKCWGAGESGQLGDAAMTPRRSRPFDVLPPGSGVSRVAAGAEHTCAVVAGAIDCWGSNVFAQIGSPRPFIALEPRRVAEVPVPASRVAAGARHTCAVAAGRLWCWGRNDSGQTGAPRCADARAHCKAAPAVVAGLPGEVRDVALGGAHSCARTPSGVWCWGRNVSGQLGDGTTDSRSEPAAVAGLAGTVSALAVGGDHACVLIDGAVRCWGANDRGQLGDGSTESRPTPVRVVDLPADVTGIATGSRHSCAASPDGVWCWGDDAEGQLDGAPGAARARPIFAGSFDAHRLAAGEDLTCAAPARGEVRCWGDDDFGQLGRGEAPSPGDPRPPLALAEASVLTDRNGDGRITVGCLGDSNTRTTPQRPRGWCERLRDLMPAEGFATVNRAEGGATAVEDGSMIHGSDHLDYALANDAVDAVIAAYGTNDLRIAHATPEQVVSAYRRFRERARAAGVDFFVALTPPARDRANAAAVGDLNERIAAAFAEREIVDFHSDMQPDDYVDELHLGDSGQDKRARAAWKALQGAADYSAWPSTSR